MQYHNIIKRIKVQAADCINIELDKNVKISIQGAKYIDVTMTERKSKGTIKKLNKNKYVVLSTGEVKEYSKDVPEGKDKKNMKKTFERLRQLIRTNFTNESDNQLFITLTYKENMTDEKQLMKDFQKFYQRLQYRLKDHKLDYIVVAEPQERGAWHMHLMLKSDQPVLYINNNDLQEKVWKLGLTKTERLKSDDVGSYYVAYFTDVMQEGKDGSKKIKKGARLCMYPKSFKFYRCSRGIEKPIEKYVEYSNVAQSGFKKIYERAYTLYDEEEERNVNFIQKETWKK